jgi:hypothetical protein
MALRDTDGMTALRQVSVTVTGGRLLWHMLWVGGSECDEEDLPRRKHVLQLCNLQTVWSSNATR